MSSRMQIGELVQHANVSHRTIHYYERIGLLKPAERAGAGYRYYDMMAYLSEVREDRPLKRLGLSLDEIAAVIDLYFEDVSGIKGKEKVLGILEAQIAKTDAQLTELAAFHRDLESDIARIKSLFDQARRTN